MNVAIRRLDDQADRRSFISGVTALDDWLARQAAQAERKRLATVWVASPVDDPGQVVGYYSLAPWQVAFEECSTELRRRLPRYPLAVSLIARLAVAKNYQGQGVGSVLLVDAILRVRAASQTIPVQAVVVQAKDERAAAWYRRFGFASFPDQALFLYLPLAAVPADAATPR